MSPRRGPPARKLPAKLPNSPKTLEIGSTGLLQWGGLVYEEFQPQLAGLRARRVFKEMAENDAIIGSILFAVDMLIRQVKWKVEVDHERIAQAEESERSKKESGLPSSYVSSDNPNPRRAADGEGSRDQTPIEAQAEEYAQFVESCRGDMEDSWESIISSVMTMLPQGWSLLEPVYKIRGDPDSDDPTLMSKYSDRLFGWRKMPIRAQDSLYKWEINPENGDILGMWQRTPPTYQSVLIPMDRALHFRTTTVKNNPEGRSALRNAYRSWFFKKIVEEMEGIGIERDLAGLPIAWVPPQMLSPTATPQELSVLAEIKKIVRNVKRDEQEGVIFPLAYDDTGKKLFDFTLMSSGGRRHFDLDATITRWDQRIAMTILADFILLGHETIGSFALGTSKIDLFTAAIEAWVNMIAAVFNHQAIPRLMKINGFPIALAPTLTHSDINAVDLKDLALYLTALSTAGMPMFPDESLEIYLRQQAGFPPPSEELQNAVEQQKKQSDAMRQMQMKGLKTQADEGSQGNGSRLPTASKTNGQTTSPKITPPSKKSSASNLSTGAPATTAASWRSRSSVSSGGQSGNPSGKSGPSRQPASPGGPKSPGGPQ